MFDGLRSSLGQLEAAFESFDAVAETLVEEVVEVEPPADRETVTTRREERRPDGTHVVTTVTRSRRASVTKKAEQ